MLCKLGPKKNSEGDRELSNPSNSLLGETETLAANLVVRRLSASSLLSIEAPDTASLVGLERKIDGFSKMLDLGVLGTLLNTAEETALPLAACLLLEAALFALSGLNARLVPRYGIHVALLDVGGHLAPGTSALVQILMLEGSQGERSDGVLLGTPGVDDVFGVGVLDNELIRPLALYSVKRLLLALAFLEQACAEGILLAAQPALTRIVDLSDIASAADNLG